MNSQHKRKHTNYTQIQKKNIEKIGWSFNPLKATAKTNPLPTARLDGPDKYRIQSLIYCWLPKGGGDYPVRFVSNPANRMAENIEPGDHLIFTEYRFGRATGRKEREIHVRDFQIISNMEVNDINEWKFMQSPRLRISEDDFLSEHAEHIEELLSQDWLDSSIFEESYL